MSSSKRRDILWAYLALTRFPNVFTAVADVSMGFLIAAGRPEPIGTFALLIFTSSCMYLAGTALNDYFDRDRDKLERPERPIPSGRVAARHALVLGLVLLGAGLAGAVPAGRTAVSVAALLALCILLYEGALKDTLLGPMLMGACRALNVALGLSATPCAIWLFDLSVPQHWRLGTMTAAGIGLYIMGVTRIARYETRQGHRVELTSTVLGFNLGLLLVGMVGLLARSPLAGPVAVGPAMPWFVSSLMPGAAGGPQAPANFYSAVALWSVAVAVSNLFAAVAVVSNRPAWVRQAVKACLLSLVVLDAAVTALFCGPLAAAALLALLLPALLLGLSLPST